MLSRKTFLTTTTLLPFVVSKSAQHTQTLAASGEEHDFWLQVRSQYSLSPDIINLNNGGVSPQPLPVQHAHEKYLKMCNQAPTYYMWRKLDEQREPLRKRLAVLTGCSPDELAINRNTTEGLNTIIAGLPLEKGDEVVLCKYDYPNMMNAWRQREKRDGIKLTWVDLQLPEEDEETLIKKYTDAITGKTKIVHITYLMNWTGQILPVKKIADAAHARGCEVIVDASHAFAHIDFSFPGTGADYLATSLHKWLCAPFGTGLLYIKKDKIGKIWPAFSAPEPQSDNIRKFESIGTRSFAAEMAVADALDFHEKIGIQRKSDRLRFLKNYWMQKVQQLPGVRFYTSLKDSFSCGIGTVGFENIDAGLLEGKLLSDYKIHTSIVKHEAINGIRITPHVYTTLLELDILVKALETLVAQSKKR